MTAGSYVTRLECSHCGAGHDAAQVHNLCTTCGSPLLVRDDLLTIERESSQRSLDERPETMWRYRVLLPVESAAVVTLGESMTPSLDAPCLGGCAPVVEAFEHGEGFLLCPKGAAGVAAVALLAASAWLSERDHVVVFDTGTGLRYAESLQGVAPARLASDTDLSAMLATSVCR